MHYKLSCPENAISGAPTDCYFNSRCKHLQKHSDTGKAWRWRLESSLTLYLCQLGQLLDDQAPHCLRCVTISQATRQTIWLQTDTLHNPILTPLLMRASPALLTTHSHPFASDQFCSQSSEVMITVRSSTSALAPINTKHILAISSMNYQHQEHWASYRPEEAFTHI